MGADNHPTTVPGNSETHTVDDAIKSLRATPAFNNVSSSRIDSADVHAVLVEDYDTSDYVLNWLTIENVYTSNGTTNIWLKIDD